MRDSILSELLLVVVVFTVAVVGTLLVMEPTARAQEPTAPPTAAIEAFEQASIVTVSALALKQNRVTDWDAVREKVTTAMQDYAAAEIERLELTGLGFPTGAGDFELFHFSVMPSEALWSVEDMASITPEQREKALNETASWALNVYAIAAASGASHEQLADAWSRGHDAAEYTTVKVRVIDWTKE